MPKKKSRKHGLITKQIKWPGRNTHSGERGWGTAAPGEKLILLPSASLNLSICHNSNSLKIFQTRAEEKVMAGYSIPGR